MSHGCIRWREVRVLTGFLLLATLGFLPLLLAVGGCAATYRTPYHTNLQIRNRSCWRLLCANYPHYPGFKMTIPQAHCLSAEGWKKGREYPAAEMVNEACEQLDLVLPHRFFQYHVFPEFPVVDPVKTPTQQDVLEFEHSLKTRTNR